MLHVQTAEIVFWQEILNRMLCNFVICDL